MNTYIDISYDEVQRGIEASRRLRSETWSRWTYSAAKAAAHAARLAVALAIEVIEATRRARRRRATIRTLSGLSDQTLKDIGLTRGSIYLIADEVSASSRPTRPGRVVIRTTSRDGGKASLAV
jgi:uncharacterized protein YjiS (DUF1127 family)